MLARPRAFVFLSFREEFPTAATQAICDLLAKVHRRPCRQRNQCNMPTAARAAQSEQTAQTPRPRRKVRDNDQPTAIPRNPSIDLALASPLRVTLAILLSKTSDFNRHLVWASNKTIAGWIGKSEPTVERHLADLEAAGRIERYDGEREVMDWFMIKAARFGPRFSQPPAALARQIRKRLIVIVAWQPPVVRPDAYGPLGLETGPSDSPSQTIKNDGLEPPTIEGCEPSEMRVAIVKTITAEPADPSKSSSTTTNRGPEAGTPTDDEGLGTLDPDPIRAGLLADIKADPRNRFFLAALRAYDNRQEATATRPTSFRENVAAGRERTPVVPALALASVSTDDPSAEGNDASAGRLGVQESASIAAAVRALPTGDLDQAERLSRRLIEAVGATHDPELVRTYGNTLQLAASGLVSPEAVADVIRQVAKPTISNPRGFLRVEFAKLRAGKNPPPGLLAKVPPAAGRNQHVPASPHCTVAK